MLYALASQKTPLNKLEKRSLFYKRTLFYTFAMQMITYRCCGLHTMLRIDYMPPAVDDIPRCG
jgi:hypothetical protein